MTVLIAGLGNLFLGDDGFGCAVAQRLAADPPPGCEVRDLGLRAFDLALALGRVEGAVLVDAVARGRAPGTLYLLGLDALGGDPDSPRNPHSLRPDQLATWLEPGRPLPPLRLVGCEPEGFGEPGVGRVGLSPRVEAAVDAALDLVREAVDLVREEAAGA